MVEIIVTAIIIGAAGYILFKNVKNRADGKCECGSCTAHCPNYVEKKKK